MLILYIVCRSNIGVPLCPYSTQSPLILSNASSGSEISRRNLKLKILKKKSSLVQMTMIMVMKEIIKKS